MLISERTLRYSRKWIGGRLEVPLAESLRIARDTGALKKSDLARVTFDTTVQPKAITLPTDATLLETAIRPPCWPISMACR
jgi:IS5 family transposase